jgi:exonuclease SbcD
MKIIHTSDWHIGKQLKKVDFAVDMSLFFKWLIDLIEQEEIDVLLMSGDLFDHANPTQHALNQYYDFLVDMLSKNPTCKMILTGGNHDSSAVINAPKELLGRLNVSVVGGVPEDISDLFIPVKKGDVEIVVAAVPFLRDKDIRKANAGESYAEKIELTRKGVANYFQAVNEHYLEHFGKIPFIVMGHLYAQGAEVSDSEREIQVGNQAGIDSAIFGEYPHYVALGHIHKPQIVGKENIRYCGSPISLSFSERIDNKQVVMLELIDSQFHIKPVKIPTFRKLVRMEGTMEEVRNQLAEYTSDSPLQDLVELQVTEEKESLGLVQELLELSVNDYGEGFKVIDTRLIYLDKIKGTSSFLKQTDHINNYSPVDMFKKLIEQDEKHAKDVELLNAFKEVLELVQNGNVSFDTLSEESEQL